MPDASQLHRQLHGRDLCGYTCTPSFADCNGSASDGCEAPTRHRRGQLRRLRDRLSGPHQRSSHLLRERVRVLVQHGGFGDCNGSAADGCEVDTTTTVANCGTCGNACPVRANATRTCASSTCGFVCSAGYGDCNGSGADGCETDLNTTAANCGTCGNACSGGTVL